MTAGERELVTALQNLGAHGAAQTVANQYADIEHASARVEAQSRYIEVLKKEQYRWRFILGFTTPILAFLLIAGIGSVGAWSEKQSTTVPGIVGVGIALVFTALFVAIIFAFSYGILNAKPPKDPAS